MIKNRIFANSKRVTSILIERTYKTSTKIPELAQVRHKVKRGDYGSLEERDVLFFGATIGSANVLQDDLQSFNIDFLRSVRERTS